MQRNLQEKTWQRAVPMSFAKGDVPDLTESVRNRVLKLNASGKLCSEIDLDKIGSGLAKLSEPIALQLLKAS